jgi:hypothetical protein
MQSFRTLTTSFVQCFRARTTLRRTADAWRRATPIPTGWSIVHTGGDGALAQTKTATTAELLVTVGAPEGLVGLRCSLEREE